MITDFRVKGDIVELTVNGHSFAMICREDRIDVIKQLPGKMTVTEELLGNNPKTEIDNLQRFKIYY